MQYHISFVPNQSRKTNSVSQRSKIQLDASETQLQNQITKFIPRIHGRNTQDTALPSIVMPTRQKLQRDWVKSDFIEVNPELHKNKSHDFFSAEVLGNRFNCLSLPRGNENQNSVEQAKTSAREKVNVTHYKFKRSQYAVRPIKLDPRMRETYSQFKNKNKVRNILTSSKRKIEFEQNTIQTQTKINNKQPSPQPQNNYFKEPVKQQSIVKKAQGINYMYDDSTSKDLQDQLKKIMKGYKRFNEIDRENKITIKSKQLKEYTGDNEEEEADIVPQL